MWRVIRYPMGGSSKKPGLKFFNFPEGAFMRKIFFTIACSLFLASSSYAEPNAFIDPNTGVLKAVGYVNTNAPGEIKIPVPADFKLTPGQWRWDGKSQAWVAVPPETTSGVSDLNDLAFAIDNAVSSPAVPAEIKAVLLQLKKV